MLLPRFSLRWLIAVLTICALFFALVSIAFRNAFDERSASGFDGRMLDPAYAVAALVIALGSVLVAALVYILFYVFAWLASQASESLWPSRRPTSPFAQHTPAPQLLPPQQPPDG